MFTFVRQSLRRYWYRVLPLKKYWAYRFRTARDDLESASTDDYPGTAPEHSLHDVAKREFATAVDILAGDGDAELADRFVERSLTAVGRLFSDNLFEVAPGCALRFPLNRATAYQIRAYAHALRGEPLDTESLGKASEDFEKQARQYDDPKDPKDPYDNNEQTRYHWVESINTALLSGATDRARALLTAVPRPIRYHRQQLEMLRRLIAFASGDRSEDEQAFLGDLNKFYDDVRDPRKRRARDHYMPSVIGALEVGLLRHRLMYRPGEEIDWAAVIEEYSA